MLTFLATMSRARTMADVNIAAGEALPQVRFILVALMVVAVSSLLVATSLLAAGYMHLNERFDKSERARNAGFSDGQHDRQVILTQIAQLRREIEKLEDAKSR